MFLRYKSFNFVLGQAKRLIHNEREVTVTQFMLCVIKWDGLPFSVLCNNTRISSVRCTGRYHFTTKQCQCILKQSFTYRRRTTCVAKLEPQLYSVDVS